MLPSVTEKSPMRNSPIAVPDNFTVPPETLFALFEDFMSYLQFLNVTSAVPPISVSPPASIPVAAEDLFVSVIVTLPPVMEVFPAPFSVCIPLAVQLMFTVPPVIAVSPLPFPLYIPAVVQSRVVVPPEIVTLPVAELSVCTPTGALTATVPPDICNTLLVPLAA